MNGDGLRFGGILLALALFIAGGILLVLSRDYVVAAIAGLAAVAAVLYLIRLRRRSKR